MTPFTHPAFARALAEWDDRYDPEARMIRTPFSSPGYHTTLTEGPVHPTRESLLYAVACLDAGDEPRRATAEAILRRVAPLQDTDPARNTYGIWSWYYEEPLERMSPPDWNWADFCGAQLLQALIDHRDRLPADLVEQLTQAMWHACQSIIQRNVRPDYTNIAIMDCYVLLVAGERLDWPEIARTGQERLARFHAFTFARGSFAEYNSPTYTRTAIAEISRLRRHAQSPAARALIDDLHSFAWKHLARHYHAPTRQWGGPHSRCYSTLVDVAFQSYLQWAGAGRLAPIPDDAIVIEVDWPRLGLEMPDEVLPYFAPLTAPRTEIETFAPADSASPAVVGTTYLAPDICFGSVSHGDLWNQRRAVLAYWGTADNPSYLHLRLLHDGYDFSSGYLFTTQRDNVVLAAITLVTDNGDTHLHLDPLKDGRLRLSDLRVRLEIGGAAAQHIATEPVDLKSPLAQPIGELTLAVQVGHAVCGAFPVTGAWLSSDDADAILHLPPGACHGAPAAALDIVLYHGPEIDIDLATLAPVLVALGITLDAAPVTGELAVTPAGDNWSLNWNLPAPLSLTAPVGPCAKARLLAKAAAIF